MLDYLDSKEHPPFIRKQFYIRWWLRCGWLRNIMSLGVVAASSSQLSGVINPAEDYVIAVLLPDTALNRYMSNVSMTGSAAPSNFWHKFVSLSLKSTCVEQQLDYLLVTFL
jgi:hypothetical protein